MSVSEIFFTQRYKLIEQEIATLINAQPEFLSIRTAQSPRAVGDAIQDIMSEQFATILGDLAGNYSASFARRAMADLAFTDTQNFYYVIDVKTHRTDTSFNMPNLISVERLTRFYEDDNNYFVLLMVKYSVNGTRLNVTNIHFVPIEFLNWNCLTIGALGWGQIQLANANIVNVRPYYSRKKWMLELCDTMLAFYPREIGKINARLNYFELAKARWETRTDNFTPENVEHDL